MFERFFLKKNAFMNAWFLFECIYDVCLNNFFLWENEFMKSWTFSFWKWIYECMIFFNAYIMYVWMILFYFMRRCIYEILDFFFLKMHLWMHGFFGFIFVFFSYVCMHNFFENTYINEIFGNAYTMYEILEKCIRYFVNAYFVNAYVDIHKLILFLWKYKHENLFFIFFQIFHFF